MNLMKKTLLLSAALIAASACGGKEQPAQPAQSGNQGPAAQAAAKPLSAGHAGAYKKKDTYFKLPSAAGGDIDLAAYAGKPVLVMFFTETCPYCRLAGPYLQKLYAKYSSKGLAVIGICLQPNPDAPQAFAKDLGIKFPLAYKGRDIAASYKTQGVPYIFALDRAHEVYDVWEGYDPSYDATLETAVQRMLAKK